MYWNNSGVAQLGITDSNQGSTCHSARHDAIRHGPNNVDAFHLTNLSSPWLRLESVANVFRDFCAAFQCRQKVAPAYAP